MDVLDTSVFYLFFQSNKGDQAGSDASKGVIISFSWKPVKSIKNIPNVKATDVNHFSAFDIVKYKKLIFTESSIKELEKRYI